MLVLPTLTKKLLNKKKEKVHIYTGVFDAGKKNLSQTGCDILERGQMRSCETMEDYERYLNRSAIITTFNERKVPQLWKLFRQ